VIQLIELHALYMNKFWGPEEMNSGSGKLCIGEQWTEVSL